MISGRVGVLCAMALLVQGFALELRAQPAVQQQGEVSFITGGIGLVEREAMRNNTAGFNLKVANAHPTGPFVAGTTIAIVDRQGNQVLETTLDGPWLMAKLPPGSYTIKASD